MSRTNGQGSSGKRVDVDVDPHYEVTVMVKMEVAVMYVGAAVQTDVDEYDRDYIPLVMGPIPAVLVGRHALHPEDTSDAHFVGAVKAAAREVADDVIGVGAEAGTVGQLWTATGVTVGETVREWDAAGRPNHSSSLWTPEDGDGPGGLVLP